MSHHKNSIIVHNKRTYAFKEVLICLKNVIHKEKCAFTESKSVKNIIKK